MHCSYLLIIKTALGRGALILKGRPLNLGEDGDWSQVALLGEFKAQLSPSDAEALLCLESRTPGLQEPYAGTRPGGLGAAYLLGWFSLKREV